MLAKCINSRLLEVSCEGKALAGSNFSFDSIKCDKVEVVFQNRAYSTPVYRMAVAKDLVVDAAGNDGLQAHISQSGVLVNAKMRSNADRDLLVMFIQYIVKRKINGELQLKNTETDSSNRDTVYHRNSSINERNLGTLKDPTVQYQSSNYVSTKPQSVPYIPERPSTNAYQSQYVDPSTIARPQNHLVRERTPPVGVSASLYLMEGPHFVQGTNKRATVEPIANTQYQSNRNTIGGPDYLMDLDRSMIGPGM